MNLQSWILSAPFAFVTGGQKGNNVSFLTLYLQVIIYMRQGWSTALASLSSLFFPPSHCLVQPCPILYLLTRGTRPHKSPSEGSLFLVCLLIFWEADRCCVNRSPKQTPSHTTCWSTRNESYNTCILICHCLRLAVEKHHLKTQWETCVRTCDTAGRRGVKKKHLTTPHVLFSVIYGGQIFTAESETRPHTEIRSLFPGVTAASWKTRERSDL